LRRIYGEYLIADHAISCDKGYGQLPTALKILCDKVVQDLENLDLFKASLDAEKIANPY